ncbi:MAG TPA: DUF2252 domain-containing protein [Acidimicrobiales bacterium]|nr:DUF2252 domain-containing protein [Acidimicrobiales bacterium]
MPAGGPQLTEPTGRAPGARGTRSPDERAALGRAARAHAPRSGHAVWEPPDGREDPIAILERQATTRVPELVAIRHQRMATSPFTFFRGAVAVMAADLATTPVSGLRVQACGDAHLSNFGGFASPERDLVFSLNDFDETLPGPWEWDLKRLAASLAIAGRARGFDDAERREVVEGAARQYRETVRDFAGRGVLATWYAHLDAAALVRRFDEQAEPADAVAFRRSVDKALTKDSARALARLTEVVGGDRRIVDHSPLVVPAEKLMPERSPAELHEVVGRTMRAYRRSLTPDRRHLLDRYRYVDLARMVVGVGSVGTRTMIALLLGRDDEDPLVLQFKQAEASALAPYAGACAYTNQGRRVVEGQRLLQATPDIMLGWLEIETFDGTVADFYVRQLWDWKLAADVDRMSPAAMRVYGEACAWTLARSHARTGDAIAIAAYLGTSDRADVAMARFAECYADQTERDHAAFCAAVASGRVTAAPPPD